MIGGVGNDLLYGQNDNDTYEWSWGDGHDYISDSFVAIGGKNRLQLAAGILPEHIALERDDVTFSTHLTGWSHNPNGGDELRVVITHPTDETLSGSVVVDRWNSFRSRWEIAFADGTVTDSVIQATLGADILQGGSVSYTHLTLPTIYSV